MRILYFDRNFQIEVDPEIIAQILSGARPESGIRSGMSTKNTTYTASDGHMHRAQVVIEPHKTVSISQIEFMHALKNAQNATFYDMIESPPVSFTNSARIGYKPDINEIVGQYARMDRTNMTDTYTVLGRLFDKKA